MPLPWKKGRFLMLWEVGRKRRVRLFWALFAAVSMVFFNFITPQIIRLTVDNVIDGKAWQLPQLAVDFLNGIGGRDTLRAHVWLCGLAAGVTALIAGLSNVIRRYFTMETGEYLAQRMRDTLYAHIQTLPYEWHVKAQTGDIIQRSTSDVETIRRFYADHLIEMFRMAIQVIFAAVLMFLMDSVMAALAMALIPLLFLFSFLFFSAVAKQFKKADEAEGALTATVQENLTGVRVVRAFGRERFEVDRFTEKNRTFTCLWEKIGHLLAMYWSISDAISALQFAIVLGAGIIRCASGDLTVGTFITFNTYAGMMIWPVRGLGRNLSELSKASVSAGRIRDIYAADPESAGNGQTPEIRGEIVFDHVSFQYDEKTPILRDVSFSVSPGETLAILGGTGSGKSTLVHLICRLYDLPEGCGTITVDGISINEIDRAHLRRNVGLVLQEPFLFSKTIRRNISASRPDAELERVRETAEIAHINDAIEAFGDGYETMVGERGVTLSGGQKQRVAIARMLMANAPIMIFDDSLSAVDTETDAKIRASLKSRTNKATAIIISHRTSTLMQADRILVLRDGAVEETGTHEELMAAGGSYRRIFDLQGELEEEMKEDTTSHSPTTRGVVK
ncbi:MAG: ABC transporter ATP-binding protein/permease [Oscillospiraceae bacterium]|jgi:ATP-binding cassette subfamily B protein|nr:ABC transporter ATP-binding protein/permease [Oscillospiraceae bacterium]